MTKPPPSDALSIEEAIERMYEMYYKYDIDNEEFRKQFEGLNESELQHKQYEVYKSMADDMDSMMMTILSDPKIGNNRELMIDGKLPKAFYDDVVTECRKQVKNHEERDKQMSSIISNGLQIPHDKVNEILAEAESLGVNGMLNAMMKRGNDETVDLLNQLLDKYIPDYNPRVETVDDINEVDHQDEITHVDTANDHQDEITHVDTANDHQDEITHVDTANDHTVDNHI